SPAIRAPGIELPDFEEVREAWIDLSGASTSRSGTIFQDTSFKDTTMKSKNAFLLAVAVLIVVAADTQTGALAADAKSDLKAPVVSIRGQVLYGRQPAPKITITLEGAAKAT